MWLQTLSPRYDLNLCILSSFQLLGCKIPLMGVKRTKQVLVILSINMGSWPTLELFVKISKCNLCLPED